MLSWSRFLLFQVAAGSFAVGCLPAESPAIPPIPSSFVSPESPETLHLSPTLPPDAALRARTGALYIEALRQEDREGMAAAIPAYLDLLKSDPSFVDLSLRIARYYLNQNDTDHSSALLRQSLKANPDSAPLQALLAHTCRLRHETEEAQQLAEESIRGNPGDPLPYRVIIGIDQDRGDTAGALAFLDKQLDLTIDSSDFWTGLGRLYTDILTNQGPATNTEIAKKTISFYRKAAGTSAPTLEAILQMALCEIAIGDTASALTRLRAAAGDHPDSIEILTTLADLESLSGDSTAALEYYEAAYKLSPGLPRLRETLSDAYIKAGRYDDAVRLLDEIALHVPIEPKALVDLGAMYEKAHSYAKAEDQYQNALNLDTGTAENYLRLAFVELIQNKTDPAVQTMAAARKRFPTSARVAYLEALALRQDKRYDDALASFQQTRILADGSESNIITGDYYLNLATTLQLSGKSAESEAALRDGLKLEPNHEELLNTLAYHFAEAGANLTEALSLSKRSLDISPGNGAYLDTLGWVYFKLQRYEDALPLLKQAVVSTHNDPVVMEHLGDTYAAAGRKTEALEQWNRVLAAAPENTTVGPKIHSLQNTEPLKQMTGTPGEPKL